MLNTIQHVFCLDFAGYLIVYANVHRYNVPWFKRLNVKDAHFQRLNVNN